ncbi:uncharacterized protein V6R79_014725 [Siganus canaliculatus]
MFASLFLVWLCVLVVILLSRSRRPKNFPPGPTALPILGNIVLMNIENPLQDFEKLRKTYGNIYSVFLGSKPAVVISGAKAVKEALVTKAADFAGRPQGLFLQHVTEDNGIVLVDSNSKWKEHRRFALTTMRNFGLGKTSMEERIRGEMQHTIKALEENNGKTMSPVVMFHNAASNIICQVLFGTRYDYEDRTIKEVVRCITENTKMANGPWAMVYDSMPLLRNLPLPFSKAFQNMKTVRCIIGDLLTDHKKTRVPGEPRDYVDSYLDELDKRGNDGSSFSEDQLIASALDLYIAGTDTTSNTLLTAFLYLITHPHVQERCQQEIDTVLEGKDQICYDDRNNMPYMMAVIHEVQRVSDTVPLSVFHRATKDTTLMGYSIPKGTLIIPNLSSLLTEEGQWKYPHEFNPENFLNDQGEFVKPEAFMPSRRPKNFPPGPTALPILGSAFVVNLENPLEDFEKLRKIYGNIYSVFLGSKPAVIISGVKAVKEALVTKAADFSGRPQGLFVNDVNGDKGIILSDYNSKWKEHRRFALMTMRNLGLGKTPMEETIHGETKHIVKLLEENIGKTMSPRVMFHNAASNVVCQVLFGRRYDYEDRDIKEIVRSLTENTKLANGPWSALYDAVPVVRNLPLPFSKAFQNQKAIESIVDDLISDHKKTRVPGEPRDYVDSYLDELDKRGNDGSSFSNDELIGSALDLYGAGTDTTANTLLTAFLYLSTYPHIQERCQKEIDTVLDGRNKICYDDRNNMPYMMAVIHEVQRLANTVPLSVFHSTTKDTELMGYSIPKGTLIIPNLNSLLKEEGQWKYTHEFNPENFLNDQGEFVKPEAFMPFSTVWLCVFVVILLSRSRRPKNFPPGPTALPIVGNVVLLNLENPLQDFEKLRKTYGNVYSMFLGSRPAVVINGVKAMKEALVTKAAEFAGRPQGMFLQHVFKDNGIILVDSNSKWKEHRRFALMTMRNFGLGKTSMEERIHGEIQHTIKALEENNGKTMSPEVMFHNAASNIICQVLFGRRYDYEDRTMKELIRCFTENTKLANGPWAMVYDSVPFIRILPLPFNKAFQNAQTVESILNDLLTDHKKTRVPGEPRDFVDCYLDELDKRGNDGSTFSENQLIGSAIDLYIAGTDTTSNTLLTAFLYLMNHPHVQERCQQEIDTVLGGKDQICYDDRNNMPYVQAVIHEVQRVANTVPLSVFHSTTKDTELMGYSIPKGTMIIPNLSSLLNEEGQWKYPHEFNPENFLNDQGEFVKPEAFMPFSTGPRVCLGEGLARMELFIILVTLLGKFKFIWPEDAGKPDYVLQFGGTQTPKPYRMKIQLRAAH